ncbi:unnamed protein product [Adineta ricciae]|uniref:CCDC92/74 N-terminal domain-containing protein n=1 Tax=Adineta ricciae TaxID=249248 RepID=A0A814U5R6_ADIRI|nr:unnamed protein product [Adineta ricciae]CAF1186729.1 unnamed protein product [Adineta ricciae]
MSDITYPSMDTNNLAQCLLRAEKSIEFLQNQHSATLADLHQELNKWQRKYNDLTFQFTLNNTEINSHNENKARSAIEQLENELLRSRNRVKTLHRVVEEKEKLINDYRNRLQMLEKKQALESYKQRSASSTRISHHSARDKQEHICHCIRLGQLILPNKPKAFKNIDEQRNVVSPTRSSSVTNRTNSNHERTKTLYIGQRSSLLQPIDRQTLPKQQRYSFATPNGNTATTKIVASRSTMKFSTILPPITNKKVPLKATLSCEGEA